MSKNIVVVGHSYISRLKDFVAHNTSSVAVKSDWGVAEYGFNIPQLIGIGGATIDTLVNRNVIAEIGSHQPVLVILQIGSNDLDNRHLSPAFIGMKIYQFAVSIRQKTGAVVYVCDPIRREMWRNFSEIQGNKRVSQAQEFLRAVCEDSDGIFSWRHRGFWNSRHNLDRVHLNLQGQITLYRSIRGAIVNAYKKL